jgi:uncharacterized protein YlzI (FlbEa/FlbD family)
MFVKLSCQENPDSSFYVNPQHIVTIAVFDDGGQTTITTVDGAKHEAAGDVLDDLTREIGIADSDDGPDMVTT